MAELPAGTIFAGHEIRGVAGRGGMGIVYRALDQRLKREVALKVIAPEQSEDREFRVRFRRECEVAASLHHPNLIPVYTAGEEDGHLYVTMRYVDGIDLAHLIDRDGRVPPGRAVDVIAQVAHALDAAHAFGVVHRDVKPANVLLDGDHALLTDFGLPTRPESLHPRDRAGHADRLVRLHGPRATRGRRRGRPHRRLRARLRPVRDDHGRGPVPARDARREDVRPPRRADPAHGRPARPGGPQGAGQAPRRPLPHRGRARPGGPRSARHPPRAAPEAAHPAPHRPADRDRLASRSSAAPTSASGSPSTAPPRPKPASGASC